jgi:uncharacterized protein YggE
MDDTGTVTVTGQGRVSGTPDMATVQLGVEVRATTAGDALDRANDRAASLLAAVRGTGVEGGDIRTRDVSLYPTFGDNGQQITGYVASNQVSVVIRDVSAVGPTLDSVAREVGDEVRFNGITFGITDTSELARAARTAAVADAFDRASQLATAAGADLGQVVALIEGSPSVGPRPMFAADAMRKGPPIEAGSQTVDVDVTVTYQLVVG